MDKIRMIPFLMLAWLVLPLHAVAGSATAQVDQVATGKKIFMSGAGSQVPACQSCHGVDGAGSDDLGTPRLASQVYTYVLKQLTDFSTGKRTDGVMHQMNQIAASLTPEQRKDVAAFVHKMPNPQHAGSDFKQLHKNGVEIGDPSFGRYIVKHGLPAQDVAACQICHGFDGRSAGLMYPMLSGQKYVYLRNQLMAFRRAAVGAKSGGRSNDFMAQMRNVAGKLNDSEINDVAAYLTLVNPELAPPNPGIAASKR